MRKQSALSAAHSNPPEPLPALTNEKPVTADTGNGDATVLCVPLQGIFMSRTVYLIQYTHIFV